MYRRIPRRLAPAVLVAASLLAPGSALAATSTATGTVSSGTLSLSTSAAPSFSATLNGTDLSPTYTVPATLNDATGSGAGWNTTITSTQFTTGGSTPQTLATTASTITGVTAVAAAGTTATAPTNAITYPLAVPAAATAPTPVKYFNAAANTGMGEFTLTPTVQAAIPAKAYAGTYTSTLTLASVSGP
jgi:hypothetical protein